MLHSGWTLEVDESLSVDATASAKTACLPRATKNRENIGLEIKEIPDS